MKYLLVIRHAKTEPSDFEHDFERKLNERGVEDCERMSRALKTTGFVPDLIKISSAKRTSQTAKYLAKHLDCKKERIVKIEGLYMATAAKILRELVSTDNKIVSLAVIGHNFGITHFFNTVGNAYIDNLPTCGMALFKFEMDNWNEISTKKGTLQWYCWPKKVKS